MPEKKTFGDNILIMDGAYRQKIFPTSLRGFIVEGMEKKPKEQDLDFHSVMKLS
jgi:hypothetical protein